jgi:hypothetical protein
MTDEQINEAIGQEIGWHYVECLVCDAWLSECPFLKFKE